MERKFSHTLRAGEGHTYLALAGVIDEDNTLAQLAGQIHGGVLALDVAEVERINSCGVRDWVNWLNKLTATGIQVVMIRCSAAIISQVNMVTNFAGEAHIHSFFAPYYNPETDESKSVLLYTANLTAQSPVRAPQVHCEETGYLMEFDDFEESYFAFINTDPRRRAPLDARMNQLAVSYTPELSGFRLSSTSVPAVKMPPSVAPAYTPSPSSTTNQAYSSSPANYTPQPPPAPSYTRQPQGFPVHDDLPTPLSASPLAVEDGEFPDSATVPMPGPSALPAQLRSPLAQHTVPPSADLPPARQPTPFTSQPQPHFITSPRDAASALASASSASANFAPPTESNRTTILVITGLGLVLVLVFAALLWLAFS